MKNLDSPGKWRCFNTSPYSLADSCRILINNLTGPVKKPPELPWLEQDKTWPAPATKTLSCLFLGDFLSIQDVDITFDSTLHTLADDSDFIIVNLEGNIGPAGQWSLFHQHNALEKFLAITRLKPANKIIVSLANNHTADYGEEGIRQTLSLLESHGFVLIGLKANPAVELVPAVWLHAISLWSNQPTCAVAALPDAKPVPGAFNILYPHWGYELELQPRPQQVLQAETLLQQWDMIVGHHAHVPQPITTHTVGGKEKLLAYSLGDFACQFRRSHYRHGCVLRAELGKTRHGETVITRTQWYFSFADFTGRNKLLIRLNKHCPYFRQD